MSAAWRRRGVVAMALLPAAWLFRLAVAARRLVFRLGLAKAERLPVPVVVVGNITVGGTGKTPLVLSLVEALRRRGRCPGVVSRGYGGGASVVREVSAAASAIKVGDEPLLLKRRSDCPVFVGRDRVAAARALLAAHPECDVLLSDDGLQHYRLRRDFEIAVLDGRGLWNGWMLPAGPLREPAARLGEVDALVLNGTPALATPGVPVFAMRLIAADFIRLGAPDETCQAGRLAGMRLHAVAGIGDPRRFFDTLTALGLRFVPHAFPDHHAYAAADLDFEDGAILTTEKDAVKFGALARLPVWVLPVRAEIEPGLVDSLMEKLDGRPTA